MTAALLVGDTVTVAVAAAPFIRFTVVGCTAQVYPAGKSPEQESDTELEFIDAGTTLNCALPDCPAEIIIVLDVGVMEKSGIFTVTYPYCELSM
jgi:hypothetical protein